MTQSRDIAIIGLACRFPDADSPRQLWENLLLSKVSFQPIPRSRWDHSRFLGNPRDPYVTIAEEGAFLRDVDRFAASHFGVAPRRAQVMDPQHRLVLETVREAFSDAGLEGRPFDRENTGVFIGSSVSEYSRLMISGIRARQMEGGELGLAGPGCEMTSRVTPIRPYTLPGSLLSMSAGVVANFFDLHGPSYNLDAACATSLLTVISAVHYLRNLPETEAGQPSAVALAGGVYVNLVPDSLIGFSRLGAMARKECRPFDRQASGFLMGEGVGIVVLKRLDQALADQDRIYAVLKGVAWNSDGRSDNPVNPVVEGQVRVMRAGFADAGLSPADIGYAECHGTATAVGDRAELAALSRVFQGLDHVVRLGSIKSNLGHTLGASGVAGLLRAVLALYHRTFPPQANWESWHPDLEPFRQSFQIDRAPVPWERANRHATVNSFAIGGHNGFVILAEAPAPAPRQPRPGPFLFRCEAPTLTLLKTYLESLRPFLSGANELALEGVAYTLGLRHSSRFQALFVAGEAEQATARLDQALSEACEESVWVGPKAGAPTGEFAGLSPLDSGPLVDLPAMPLERLSYWAIEPESPAPTQVWEGFAWNVLSPLIDTVARLTGCPTHSLRPHQCLRQLGLHLGGLETELRARLGLAVSPDFLSSDPTLADLAEHAAPHSHTLSGLTHPFLDDHKIRDRAFLPLASALDLFAWSQNLSPPWSLCGVRVERGLRVPEQARIALHRQGMNLQILEIRPDGRQVLAFQARLGGESRPPAPPPDDLGTDPQSLLLSLEEFYSSHTFHGPRLRGIDHVESCTANSLVGWVTPCVPSQWCPLDPRSRWHLDPLVVDSAFQLGLYWAVSRLGKALLPVSLDEIRWLRPTTGHLVQVVIGLTELQADGARIDLSFFQQGERLGWIRGLQARLTSLTSLPGGCASA